ncbi:19248_t:CDS:2 [Cetraspora pellucida]|uniref:19248_t:CDS:1 n=1 Tax=Cetraspora pellucida TaxID=1433469 RepID=A0A9N8VWL2_9GLOM|nr:19248_t:CDS:2 [Cetraspora pellucida]
MTVQYLLLIKHMKNSEYLPALTLLTRDAVETVMAYPVISYGISHNSFYYRRIIAADINQLRDMLTGLEVTNPFKGVTWKGGNKQTITWRDDNGQTSPSLKDLNSLTIGLYNGNATDQVFVAELGKNIKGTKLKFEFKVPKDIGPKSNNYFLILSQFIGKDEYTSYSGHFSIKGVSGSITIPPGGPSGSPTGTGSSPTGTDSPNSPNNPSATPSSNGNNSPYSNTTSTPSSSDGYSYYGNANKIESSVFGFAGKLVIAGLALGISFIF